MQLPKPYRCAAAQPLMMAETKRGRRSRLLAAAAGLTLFGAVAAAHADPTPTAPPAAPATPDASASAPTAGPSAPPTAATSPAAPAAPMPSPMSSPSMTAPLSANPNPVQFDAGPLGKVYVTGQITGLGLVQSNHVPGDRTGLFDISNGQVEVQTTSGPVQFYVQAGAYSLPSLGSSYIRAGDANSLFFGPVPVAYAKIVATPEISFQVGALPTLIGAEYTFTFQNMNIERGLLWNQEPAVSKGVQANYAKGPLSISVSYNDGYYSDHYDWISGLLTWTINGSNTLAFAAGGDLGHYTPHDFKGLNAPLFQSNSSIYNIMYTYSMGPVTINPYFQYSHVDANPGSGIYRSASTTSGAVLAKYNFTPEFAIAGRVEYISTSGGTCPAGDASCLYPTNLLYGPGSDAWSITLTPTYQKGIWFARGEVSYTGISSLTPGDGFSTDGMAKDQVRGLFETGFLF